MPLIGADVRHLAATVSVVCRHRPRDPLARGNTAMSATRLKPCTLFVRRDRVRPPLKRVSGDWPRWQRHAAMARPSPCRQAVRHKFPRGNCPVGQHAKPHFESKATSHCLRTLRSGPAPGPGRRVSRSADRHIATRRFSGGRPSSERHFDVHSIRCKEATRRRNKDGDGRTVRSGEIKANAGHVRRNSDHARHDAMAVTRRPFARRRGACQEVCV